MTPTAWLNRPALEFMIQEAKVWSPHETGGVLIGYLDAENRDIIVEQAIGPGPRAKHAKSSFMPDQTFHEQEIARIYSQTGRTSTYIGDWHSHPYGGAYLSGTDRQTLERIARSKEARTPRPLMAVMAGPEWDVCIWQARLVRRKIWWSSVVTTKLKVRLFER